MKQFPRTVAIFMLILVASIACGSASNTAAQSPPAGSRETTDIGCRFADRCAFYLGEVCATQPPPLRPIGAGHTVRCHLPPDQLPATPDLAEEAS